MSDPTRWLSANRKRDQVCATCGAAFRTVSARYCSLACRPNDIGAVARRQERAIESDRRQVEREADRGYRDLIKMRRDTDRLIARISRRAAKHRKVEARARDLEKHCPMCAEPFTADSRSEWYCPACRPMGKKEARHHARARRRARERGAFVERVYRKVVFERDGWRCRLCGKPVEKAAEVPDANAPTLDHIIPLAVGGAHSYANVQLAHFLCNSYKSAATLGPGEQLRWMH